MNQSPRLSKRLKMIADMLPEKACFADIGTDHAHLPSYICMRNTGAGAIAGEIQEGPLERAKETVKKYGLAGQIDVRHGYGLDVIAPGEVEQLVISGMGGILIRMILRDGAWKLSGIETIIIQPNTDNYEVRHFVHEQGYTIVREEMVQEKGHIYEIIQAKDVCAESPPDIDQKDLFFGPIFLEEKPPLFYVKWEREYKLRDQIIRQMKQALHQDEHKMACLAQEMEWIKEELYHGPHID